MYLKSIVIALALGTATPVLAGSCTENEYDKADYFLQQIGKKIAAKNDGDTNVRVSMVNCDYNSYSNEFRMAVGIYWSGTFSGDPYNTDGEVKISGNGGTYEYSEAYANQNLKDWRVLKGFVVAAVVVGSIAAEK